MAVKPDVRRPLRRAIEQYYAIRKTHGVALAPDASQLTFVSNLTGSGELWRIGAMGGWPHQLTTGGHNVIELSWCPRGDALIYSSDWNGDENFELFSISPRGGLPQALNPAPGSQAHLGDWSPDGRYFVYSSNKRDPAFFDIYIVEPATGTERVIWQDDNVNMALSWSGCGRYILVQQFEQNANQDLFLLEVASGADRCLTPHEGLVRHLGGAWEPGGDSFLFLTDYGRDFLALARMDLRRGAWEIVEAPDADVVEVAVSRNGRWRALTINRGGVFQPEVCDLETGTILDLPELSGGVASELTFSWDSSRLALYFESPQQAKDLWVVDLPPHAPAAKLRPALRQLTFSMFGGIEPQDLCVPQRVSYQSFDGLDIPALMFVPSGAQADGTMPAIIWPHGGPDSQIISNFHHLFQIFVGSGYVVLAPNFRGSTGYGKAYHKLNRRDWGGASFRDLVSGCDFLIEQQWADPARIAVVGGSFGGFMALTAAVREPDRWAAIVDFFGPSNLLTFIESTPTWWKPYLHEMVGDPERDRQMLEERSPVNFLECVRAPLLVIQGAHDPRVTKAESDQVVERLRALGREVQYLVFEDEGHGFSRTNNEIQAVSEIIAFLDRHLGLG